MLDLTSTRVMLARRQLIETLISLEEIEGNLRKEQGDTFFETNEDLLKKIKENKTVRNDS